MTTLTTGPPPAAAAVVYAKHIATLARFYEDLLGLPAVLHAADHVVLANTSFELVLLAMPAAIAAQIHIAAPPVVREDTPVKLCFAVPSLAAARARAHALGGWLKPPAAEWRWRGVAVCDGVDPEGNVFQLREITP